MKRSAICWGAAGALAVGIASTATARPFYLQTFKAHYNTATGKPTLNAANCSLCHIGMPNQRMWNPWGQAVRAELNQMQTQDRNRVIAAFTAAEKKTNTANQTFASLIQADRMPGAPPAAAAGSPPGLGASQTTTWEPVFNGVNMDGWTKMNQGNWTVENFILKYTGGGNGWLRSNKQYRNYSAVIVWRYPAAGNNDSGIFLKAPLQGNPWPGGPQLNMGPGDNFGSIGGTQGTRPRADLIKRNDWNTYQITVWNGMASLAINGQPAWELATGLPTGEGYLGIQAENFPLDVAQVWVMPLP